MPLRVPTVLVAVRFQQVVEELHVELVVLHDQDGLGHWPPHFPLPQRPRGPFSGRGRALAQFLRI